MNSYSYRESAVASFDEECFDRDASELERELRERCQVAITRADRFECRSGRALAGELGRQSRDIVAWELGFECSEDRSDALSLEGQDRASLERASVVSTLEGGLWRSRQIQELRPHQTHKSRATLLAQGGDESGEIHISSDQVDEPIEPLGWPPLVYACCSRWPDQTTFEVARRISWVQQLLESGADPSSGRGEHETVRGYRTLLGGAVGCRRSSQLVQLLLKHGADPDDGPTLYEGSAIWSAVEHADAESLRHLIASGTPQWLLSHALPHSLGHHDIDLVQMLMDAGADPNWNKVVWGFDGTALHEALTLCCKPEMLAALLRAGAHVDLTDYCGRTPLAVATALSLDLHAELLHSHGADPSRVRSVDRWVGQCFSASSSKLRSDLPMHAVDGEISPIDQLWVCRASRLGKVETVRRLLEGGCDPNGVDYDGNTALHIAAANTDTELVDLLTSFGASESEVNYSGNTPLDCALQEGLRARLGSVVEKLGDSLKSQTKRWPQFSLDFADHFEHAAEAVVSGDESGLRNMLTETPELVVARSRRAHRCTLLHYLGANGFEEERQSTPPNAVAVIELLVQAGAEPNQLSCTYRGGPNSNTIGLMVSSTHPKRAGLLFPMVGAMVSAGGHVDETYRLLIRVRESIEKGKLQKLKEVFDPMSRVAGQALVEAATLGDLEIVASLLDLGVNIDTSVHAGATAIHNAAHEGHRELSEYLIQRGADPRLRDDIWGGNACGWAHAGGHAELANWIFARIEEIPEAN